MIKPYSREIERQMKKVYDSLEVEDKRMYAAIEVQKLPRGGLNYIAKILGCDRKTINRGIKELTSPFEPLTGRIRNFGVENVHLISSKILMKFLSKSYMNTLPEIL